MAVAVSPTATLRVRIEEKSFGPRPVLAGVEFAAMPGEVLALLAPSGTGKTTALRIVLGLESSYAGRVDRPAGRVGAVFQEPRLLPWLDVAANLRLVAPALTDSQVVALLGDVGLHGISLSRPGALSLGMARRVALARALAVRPSLLVLDEPFASLDPMLAAGIARDVAARSRALNTVVLLATHDIGQALAIADRLLILSGNAPARLGADVAAGSVDRAALEARFPFLRG